MAISPRLAIRTFRNKRGGDRDAAAVAVAEDVDSDAVVVVVVVVAAAAAEDVDVDGDAIAAADAAAADAVTEERDLNTIPELLLVVPVCVKAIADAEDDQDAKPQP